MRSKRRALPWGTLGRVSPRRPSSRDLAAQLPKELQQPLRPRAEDAERFGLEEFVRRVSQRASVDDAQAWQAVQAVFTTLHEAVTRGEFDDVLSQLPQEFTDVIEPATDGIPTRQAASGGEPR